MAQVFQLKACCLSALQEIRDVEGITAVGARLLATSPLIAIVGSGPIDATMSVSSTDWDLLTLAVEAVPKMRDGAARRIALSEVLRHKGGPLNKFWKSMFHAFGG